MLDSLDPSLLSVIEVAGRLGISDRHVKRLIQTGELPTVKIGRRRLVTSEALAAFIRELAGRPGRTA